MATTIDLRAILEWWTIDYQENLILRITSWLRKNIDAQQLQKEKSPFAKSMFYVVDLADKLADRGFRVKYVNFSWLEWRNNRHGGWPDLFIGKNGYSALVEVKGKLSFRDALMKIVGKNASKRTNFFTRAKYLNLAKDIGTHLFLAYYDANIKNYLFIPVYIERKCLKVGRRPTCISDLNLKEESMKSLEEKIEALSIDKIEELFLSHDTEPKTSPFIDVH